MTTPARSDVKYALAVAAGYLLIILFAVWVFDEPDEPDQVTIHCDYARDPKSIACTLQCDREKTCLDLALVLTMLEVQTKSHAKRALERESQTEEVEL